MTDDDTRTDEDHSAAKAIMTAVGDPDTLVERIFTYYQDAGRAARTPRATIYLHLGLLAGVCMRAKSERS